MGQGFGLSSFVGRERELAQLSTELAGTRLLLLTGAAGVGKTRLAIALAGAVEPRFPDGLLLVELAAVAEPGLVTAAVAAAAGVAEEPDRPLVDVLCAALRDRAALLVLDNCEHVADACAELVAVILTRCPDLRVIATSRIRLYVAGALTWRVPSMAESEAVQLFAARARSVCPEFAVTGGNARLVAGICRRLDGIPLAVELAAARLRVLSVEQLASRLSDQLGLLTNGGRTAPRRQRTLRATLEWSFRLLDASTQAMLNRVAVFVGGFDLEAVESVSDDGAAIDELEHLVDHSLLEVDRSGPRARYRLLEVVRQYASEQSDHICTARERHARWCVALAEQAEPQLRGVGQAQWLARLDVEHANMRAALAWSQGAGAIETGLRLAGALRSFWEFRGYLTEGRRWCEALLAADGTDPGVDSVPQAVVAKVRYCAGLLAYRLGDIKAATAHIDAYLLISEATGDALGIARACNVLGMITEMACDFPASARWFELSLDQMRVLGDAHGVAVVSCNLGLVVMSLGDLARARDLMEESLALQRKIGASLDESGVLGNLASVALAQKDLPYARASAGAALAGIWRLNNRQDLPGMLAIIVRIAVRSGHPEQAVRLLGAAEAVNEEIGTEFTKAVEDDLASELAVAQRRLGGQAFTAARAAGRVMPIADAVALAMRLTRDDPQPAGLAGGLTRREHEVVVRVARGLTNRQIADELTISIRTVDTHVAHILGKLELSSRVQIAAWATEHQLM